jgi:hypothetical protein
MGFDRGLAPSVSLYSVSFELEIMRSTIIDQNFHFWSQPLRVRYVVFLYKISKERIYSLLLGFGPLAIIIVVGGIAVCD